MSNEVYANSMEVSCKQAAGKSICAFPDVCMTPPQTPATPPGVPIPYPNTGMASDTSDGSSTVKISNQEVMLKNKSSFKKSTGDEAGAAPMKGVVTHKNMGKVYFTAWSMDVKIEGENVVRTLDMTTHNHGSVPGNTGPWPYIDASNTSLLNDCQDDIAKEAEACKDCTPNKKKEDGGKDPCEGVLMAKPPSGAGSARDTVAKPKADQLAGIVAANDCLNARRCKLSPYADTVDDKGRPVRKSCCEGQTPHHIVEKSSFGDNECKDKFSGFDSYDPNSAPCVCAEGTGHSKGGTHELMHVFQKAATLKDIEGQTPKSLSMAGGGHSTPHPTTTYKKARDNGVEAFGQVFPDAGCNPKCIQGQLDAYHNQHGIHDGTEVKAVTEGPAQSTMTTQQAKQEIALRSWNRNQTPAIYRRV
ncbi:MAG: DUF4150 domain-containing protein [Burkholderiaceae bacterium]|nr:MAG: DUF4150 domain-containing protein [Burkholderiaceae bacterium]MCC7285191.1 DUF4150 domain-containing protein [Burkholderiaceae bacterium]